MTQEASRRQSSRQKPSSSRRTTGIVLGFSSRGGSPDPPDESKVRRTTSASSRAIEGAAWAYASPQVQSALPAKRDGPRAPQIRPRKSKLIQINPRKIAWVSSDFFGGSGAFQWVTANPNKKFFSCHTVSQMSQKPKARAGREFPLATTTFRRSMSILVHLEAMAPATFEQAFRICRKTKEVKKFFCFSEY